MKFKKITIIVLFLITVMSFNVFASGEGYNFEMDLISESAGNDLSENSGTAGFGSGLGATSDGLALDGAFNYLEVSGITSDLKMTGLGIEDWNMSFNLLCTSGTNSGNWTLFGVKNSWSMQTQSLGQMSFSWLDQNSGFTEKTTAFDLDAECFSGADKKYTVEFDSASNTFRGLVNGVLDWTFDCSVSCSDAMSDGTITYAPSPDFTFAGGDWYLTPGASADNDSLSTLFFSGSPVIDQFVLSFGAPPNNLPTLGSGSFNDTSYEEYQDMEYSMTVTDLDGDTTTISITWANDTDNIYTEQKGPGIISGTVLNFTLDKANYSQGQNISLEADANDGFGVGPSLNDQIQILSLEQCEDGLDNDADAATDYPDDFSCSSSQDNDETNPKSECQDSTDNDLDLATDFPADFSCASLQDDDETSPLSECQDGLDNDADTVTDLADNDCTNAQDNTESGTSQAPTGFVSDYQFGDFADITGNLIGKAEIEVTDYVTLLVALGMLLGSVAIFRLL